LRGCFDLMTGRCLQAQLHTLWVFCCGFTSHNIGGPAARISAQEPGGVPGVPAAWISRCDKTHLRQKMPEWSRPLHCFLPAVPCRSAGQRSWRHPIRCRTRSASRTSCKRRDADIEHMRRVLAAGQRSWRPSRRCCTSSTRRGRRERTDPTTRHAVRTFAAGMCFSRTLGMQ